MRYLILAAVSLAVVSCFPVDQHVVSVTEDTLGNYKFSFDAGDHSKYEERDRDGNTHGHFDFVDPEGGQHRVEYVASIEKGFVPSGADLPVVPAPEAENPEVVKARTEHLAIWQATADANGIFEEEPTALNVKTSPRKTIKIQVPVVQYIKA